MRPFPDFLDLTVAATFPCTLPGGDVLEGIRAGIAQMSRLAAGVGVVCLLAGGSVVGAQASEPSLPFAVGETLDYRVKIPIFGTVGKAVFRIEGPVAYRGEEVLLLRSDVTTKWGPVRGNSASMSWFDPDRLLSLRFEKDERQPAYHDEENVELFPSSRRFELASGVGGDMPTDAPLDELSFIYFLRTMELLPDSTVRFTRHYDVARNPTIVRLLRRESVETALGWDEALVIEMRVRHPRHYKGEGVIRIHLSDDPRRIPLKIESSAPATGKVTLVLERYTPPPSATAIAVIGR
jgi:hypothetical protein